ncbi:MFS transporter [Acidocella sp.]|jgi:DHA2 family multidrug resistance protein|uniref:MFS transporter n=1 Tax=Acidocella sp. TaxID=50710 RepID=UPI002F3F6730
MSEIVAPPPAPPGEQAIPWLGLTAVLLGTFMSTLTGRLSTFGLTDVRGALHAGFDEGAWITTAFTVAQMLITPIAVWIGSIYGPRRILIVAALEFAFASFLLPFSQNLTTFLALQFLAGLGSGCFIPLTLSFILRNMPPRLWAYGVALYALNLELSLNISASVEGWYVDNLTWHWIFWQNVPLALGMAACLFWGVRSLPPPPRIHTDGYGLMSCGLGLALIYAALDQGNRLDWGSSGLIWGLTLAGIIMIVSFVVHGRTTPDAWLDFKVATAWPLPLLLLMIAILRLTILSTSYLIPYYLGGVRGFRALQVGDTLIWIAAPQLIICPLAAFMLRRSDPRITASLGLCLVGLACMAVAYTLTPSWGSDQFLPSQLMQAVGQSFALSGIVFTGVLNLKPQDALSFGAMLQIARLFGGEAGTSFITTMSRIREQRASNLIGLHLQIGSQDVQQRLAIYGRVLARSSHQPQAAPVILGNLVRTMATTQATIDCFVAVAAFAVFGLFMLLLVLPAPPRTPASHIPFFSRKKPG